MCVHLLPTASALGLGPNCGVSRLGLRGILGHLEGTVVRAPASSHCEVPGQPGGRGEYEGRVTRHGCGSTELENVVLIEPEKEYSQLSPSSPVGPLASVNAPSVRRQLPIVFLGPRLEGRELETTKSDRVEPGRRDEEMLG